LDWSRAKSALIVAFLVLDLFLGWQVRNRVVGMEPGSDLTVADVRSVQAKIEAGGVRVECPLPRSRPSLSYLVVRPGTAVLRDTQARLLGAEDSPGGLATLLDNGVLIYTREVGSHAGAMPKNDAIGAARAFVERFAGRPMDLEFDYAVALGEAWLINFCSKFDGKPVFDSYARVLVRGAEVAEARFSWFEPVGYSQQRRSVVASTDAVMAAVAELGGGARGQSVAGVSLGYHSEPYDAKQWESVPVWRVLFGSGQAVYVNAHTGEVERPERPGR
jgi:hypothetical protein